MSASPSPLPDDDTRPWYQTVSRYQWLVLIIASAGWVFDVYEGQIFNITRGDMLKEILADQNLSEEALQGTIKNYGDRFLAIFLVGGTFGGLLFGSLADRYGRRPIMIATILMYSVFSGLTYFAENLWQVGILRFLVAMGVGGEWAVAASLVSEVFPAKARAQASGIFHASSVLGTWLAGFVGILIASQWRYGYLVGILPALLIVWVRIKVKEPEKWQQKKSEPTEKKLGSFKELFATSPWRLRALAGMGLAAVGLGTFWAVTVAGQDLAKEMLLSNGIDPQEAGSRAKFAYGIWQTIGGGLGLLAFGPIAARFGRKRTFLCYQIAALIIVPVTCYLPQSYSQLMILLPIYGFFTLGIHAGFAIYFPELFPTHLRATGTSFCFNGGRLLAAPILVLSGFIKEKNYIPIEDAVTYIAGLFVVGIALLLLLPETRMQELPE
ncbi:MAG: MFS transporter [Planctomycetaceae bacterium]|nr:MFS transporter [Planctomycetaceae bacterium]